MRTLRWAIGLACLLLAVSLAACGATEEVAPAAEKTADIRQCRSFELLMPNFLKAISEGRTENLKRLVEEQLLVSPREGVPPPINDVLRSIFRTLERLASKPPESGAPAGEYCAPTATPPPLELSNELCELRRSLDVLVHQGKGIDAVELVEPQLLLLLNYVTGTGQDCKGRRRVAHYEVAGLISSFCTQTQDCQLVDGLDAVIAFSAYLRTPEGRALVDHVNELVGKPSVRGLLNPSALTEEDMVAIARGLLPALQNPDAQALENAFNTPLLPEAVRADLRPVVDDLKKVIVREDLMRPVRRSLNCYVVKDRNLDLIRMVYRLGIEEACEPFGLTRLAGAVQGLQNVDARGSLVYLAGTLAAAVRADELAVDAAAQVCRDVFTTARAAGQVRSNAELALPVAADLVAAGVVNEAICAVDTLLFGCAGGAQPACR
jgi:hypothetical protein